jgi:hypothetical protein
LGYTGNSIRNDASGLPTNSYVFRVSEVMFFSNTLCFLAKKPRALFKAPLVE